MGRSNELRVSRHSSKSALLRVDISLASRDLRSSCSLFTTSQVSVVARVVKKSQCGSESGKESQCGSENGKESQLGLTMLFSIIAAHCIEVYNWVTLQMGLW